MHKIRKKMFACTMLISMMFEFSAYQVVGTKETVSDANLNKKIESSTKDENNEAKSSTENSETSLSNSKVNEESNDSSDLAENSDNSSSDKNEESNANSSDELSKIRDLLSDDAKFIFDSIDKKTFTDDIYKKLKRIYNHFENFYFDTEEKTKLADLSVMSLLNENDVLTNNKNDALRIIENIFNEYSESMKNRYTPEDYQNMVDNSNLFGEHTKNTSSCAPENVIILSKYQVLSDYPIIYNDNILLSLDDIVSLLNRTISIEHMKENENIILRSEKGEKGSDIIELSPGDNKIGVNDKEKILNNPVINWQGTIFVSTDIFNFIDENAKERSCRTILLPATENENAKVVIF